MSTEASLLKWKPYLQIKPKPGPLTTITYMGRSGSPILILSNRCNGTRGGHSSSEPLTTWEVRRNPLRRSRGRFIHLADGVGDGPPQRATTIYPLTWTSLIKGPIDKIGFHNTHVCKVCCVLQVNMKHVVVNYAEYSGAAMSKERRTNYKPGILNLVLISVVS